MGGQERLTAGHPKGCDAWGAPHAGGLGQCLALHGRKLPPAAASDPPGLIIINAQGIIMATNKALLGLFGVRARAAAGVGRHWPFAAGVLMVKAAMLVRAQHCSACQPARPLPAFGPPTPQYERGELEQKNVSSLMPQPFSSRHNGCAAWGGALLGDLPRLGRARHPLPLRILWQPKTKPVPWLSQPSTSISPPGSCHATLPLPPALPRYLNRYVQTGEARILNSTRYVVGLTKQHAVVPIALSVVKLAGSAEESVFMGCVRPTHSADPLVVRMWVAPGSGFILTADEAFVDQFGVPAADLVGRPASTLGLDIEALEK